MTISASSGGKKLNLIKPLATSPTVKINIEIAIATVLPRFLRASSRTGVYLFLINP